MWLAQHTRILSSLDRVRRLCGAKSRGRAGARSHGRDLGSSAHVCQQRFGGFWRLGDPSRGVAYFGRILDQRPTSMKCSSFNAARWWEEECGDGRPRPTQINMAAVHWIYIYRRPTALLQSRCLSSHRGFTLTPKPRHADFVFGPDRSNPPRAYVLGCSIQPQSSGALIRWIPASPKRNRMAPRTFWIIKFLRVRRVRSESSRPLGNYLIRAGHRSESSPTSPCVACSQAIVPAC
nr:hypothetical protein CFP56_63475 [Quercus suber]